MSCARDGGAIEMVRAYGIFHSVFPFLNIGNLDSNVQITYNTKAKPIKGGHSLGSIRIHIWVRYYVLGDLVHFSQET